MATTRELLIILFSLSILSGCTQNITSYKGDYRNIQGHDTYSSSIKTYEAGSKIYNSGYTIKLDYKKYVAVPVIIDEKGKTHEPEGVTQIELTQSDIGVLQHSARDRSSIRRFIFSNDTLIIDEYRINNEGNYIKKSRMVLEKI